MLDGEYVEQCSRYSMVSMSSSAHDARWRIYRVILTILDGEYIEHFTIIYKYTRYIYLENIVLNTIIVVRLSDLRID